MTTPIRAGATLAALSYLKSPSSATLERAIDRLVAIPPGGPEKYNPDSPFFEQAVPPKTSRHDAERIVRDGLPEMLISVHLPKTAGSSFGRSLEDHFGERLLRDYGDLPLNTTPGKRNARALRECGSRLLRGLSGVECIHGHFLPLKYRLIGALRHARFVTWIRDPVERIASHYYYWQRSYDAVQAAPLHRRVVEEQWSLERFCLAPELKNVYCQFLWGFPLSRFDFIGVTEYYAEDFCHFAQTFLGGAACMYEENTNEASGRRHYAVQRGLRRRIEAEHKRDMALYRRVVEMRRERLGRRSRESDAKLVGFNKKAVP